MTVRKYTSRSQQTTLSSAVTSGATVIPVTNASTLLAGTTISAGQTFTIVIDPDTALEEIVEVTSASSNNLTVTRAVDMSGASAQDHSSGAVVRHMIIGRDLREANLHIEATAAYNDGTGTHTLHGLTTSDGVITGTTATQTLTNKTLTTPVVNGATLSGTITSTATVTGGTITGATITGLSSAGMVSSSATPKDYVDSILGSATAAATSAASAATSATAAATSATSAAASATAAATSATSSAASATASAASASTATTQATAAATSATSAAASATAAASSAGTATTQATAAATSATSAAASATAAATSATSAAASATASAASASTATTQATNAAASATAASTSATSAAASATAAATSATSAAVSATAAATSAASALTSQTAAATSASSAATSATAAATSAADALTSANSAATTYDNFDDRYLGAKTSAPTVDNDGNPLLTGALYFNSTLAAMYVWTGTVWSVMATSGDIESVSVTSPLTGGGASGAVTVGIQAATTAQSGAIQLTDSTTSTSTSTAATPNSVKSAYDLANAAIPKSLADAKGDLVTATADNTPARLAVGNNGETLVADSSTSTGLRYQEPLNLNPVLNSGFDIFQRGTASTAIGSGTFLADRWQAARVGFAAGGSQSRQVTGDTTNLPSIQYCLRVQRDSGNTSTANLIVGQNVESVNSIPYAGKTITFSFYARAGANYSSASSVLTTNVASGTGTDQNLITAGTLTGIDSTITNHTLTTTWQRFTVTKNVASTATQLAFQFSNLPVGTAGANDYFEVTGVMINVGSVAYPFRRTTGTIQGELGACQRYYERWSLETSNFTFPGFNASTTNGYHSWHFHTKKRSEPTISVNAAGDFSVRTPGGNITCTAFSTIGTTTDGAWLSTTVASGLGSGNGNFLVNSGVSPFIQASSEL